MFREDFIDVPAGTFRFGCDPDQAPGWLRQRDRELNLGLGAVLANTPGHWVDLPGFAIQRRMVSNAAYHAFWTAPHPERPGVRIVDDAEIWRFVWEQHGLGYLRVPGIDGSEPLIETYAGCNDAADALVLSHAFECQRLVFGHHLPASEAGFDTRSRAVVRCFAAMRRWLADTTGGSPALGAGALNALQDAHPAGILDDVLATITACNEQLGGEVPTSLIGILRRFAAILSTTGDGPPGVVPSRLFRPLLWPEDTERALKEGGGMFRQKVPFADLPVMGVSLYEAAGFAAWGRLVLGEDVSLPSEAEYEKAFGWTWDGPLPPRSLERKLLFPWQDREQMDFNQLFSCEGERLQQLQGRRQAWERLVARTGRMIGNKVLEHGLGFGWQWTREPYDEVEQRYNRFSQANWPRTHDGALRWRDARPSAARYFAVRGAPDQLGGPGTVTRRFALYPLRGYAECGFRCVISPGQVHG
ncbi:MAG: Sulfatase-modifying factor enzyme 1 [Planctomycetota bacterium]|jgi:formylglycine-generating enzyme required for sulfatase activity